MRKHGRRAPSKREWVTRVPHALAFAPAVLAAGCNLVFGIGGGDPLTASSSAAGPATSTTGTGGTGGAGGASSTTGSTGGTGGSCGFYDGDGTLTATNLGAANIATITFYASGSISAVYQSGDDA